MEASTHLSKRRFLGAQPRECAAVGCPRDVPPALGGPQGKALCPRSNKGVRATRGHGGPRKHIGALQAPRPAPGDASAGGGGATPVPSWCRRVDRKTEAASAFLRPVGTATWESLTQAEAQTVSPGGRRGKGGPARGSEGRHVLRRRRRFCRHRPCNSDTGPKQSFWSPVP